MIRDGEVKERRLGMDANLGMGRRQGTDACPHAPLDHLKDEARLLSPLLIRRCIIAHTQLILS
jgi:hypothetical protein